MLLSICLIFNQFQPGVAYKRVVYKKKRVIKQQYCHKMGNLVQALRLSVSLIKEVQFISNSFALMPFINICCACLKSITLCICRFSTSYSPSAFQNIGEFEAKNIFTYHQTTNAIRLFVNRHLAVDKNLSKVKLRDQNKQPLLEYLSLQRFLFYAG